MSPKKLDQRFCRREIVDSLGYECARHCTAVRLRATGPSAIRLSNEILNLHYIPNDH